MQEAAVYSQLPDGGSASGRFLVCGAGIFCFEVDFRAVSIVVTRRLGTLRIPTFS